MNQFDGIEQGLKDPGPEGQGIDRLEQDLIAQVERDWGELRKEALHNLNTRLVKILAESKADLRGRFSSFRDNIEEAKREPKHTPADIQEAKTIGMGNRKTDVQRIKREMRDKLQNLKLVK